MKHIVIIGAGFAGLDLAKKLRNVPVKVTLIDKHNYHQFAPLFYQVATSSIEPSSILFPLRQETASRSNCTFRMAKVRQVDLQAQCVITDCGEISYDYLVVATGAGNNFFGMASVERHAYPMKSLSEALSLNNHLLTTLEEAGFVADEVRQEAMLTFVIVGGGPTGVELAGALGDMKRFIIRHDYPELRDKDIRIILAEGSSRLLGAMSEEASRNAARYLEQLGVDLWLNKRLIDYDGYTAKFADNSTIGTRTLIWASGVGVKPLKGLESLPSGRGGRFLVDAYNRPAGFDHVFILGDACYQTEPAYPDGHPQVAPVAMQQAANLARNLRAVLCYNKAMKPFRYRNRGAMAIVGRNRAVADLKHIRLRGFPAWSVWLFVHLMSILGIKNRLFVLLDWAWTYITHDASLRLIIKAGGR